MREDQKSPGGRQGNCQDSRPTIGLLIESVSGFGEHQTAIWTGVADAAQERNANLICFAGGRLRYSPIDRFETQRNVLYGLVTADNVDGLIVSSTLGSFAPLEEFRRFCDRYHPLPIVTIGAEIAGIPSILMDNDEGMRDLIVHLIEVHGYRRIAFIRGPEDNLDAEARYRTYKEVLTEYGFPLDLDLVAPGNFLAPSGAAAIHLLLDERKVDFEAVIAANDNMAITALRALQARGMYVPRQVAVVGFDDTEEANALIPALTTVRQPMSKLGERASETLLALLEGEQVPGRVVLSPQLVVRQSCGCLATEVVRARAGEIDGSHQVLGNALAAMRERVLAEIVEAPEALAVESALEETGQLLDAFSAELEGKSPGIFLATLNGILHQVAQADGDVALWQGVISVLRRQILASLGDGEALARAEDLWQQARVMIGEAVQRVQAWRRMQVEQQAALLREISEMLITTVEVKGLMDMVARELPRLGIPGCYVSLYGRSSASVQPRQQKMPAESSRLVLAYDEGGRVELEGEGRVFPSRQLVPDGILRCEKRYSMVVEPLYFREEQLGYVLFEMGPREGMVYEALRGQLSSVLERILLVQQVQRGQEHLHSLYEASSAIVSLQDPQKILQEVVERTCDTVEAWGASVVWVDEGGHAQRLTERELEPIDTDSLVRFSGIAVEVIRSGKQILIDDVQRHVDQASPQQVEDAIDAVGCFPLWLRGRSIGVIWVYYKEPHHFSDVEVNALGLYANQAATAYGNAKRMQELEHLRLATEKLASVAGVQEVLQQIVWSAREVLQADSVVIWSYDPVRQTFLPDELVTDDMEPELVERSREDKPRRSGTAEIVMRRAYLAVTDVDDPEYDYLDLDIHGLRGAGVKSFQGIALQAEDEILGVLYVNYRQHRRFDEEDRSVLETFAYHAALTLKKARLLEQVRTAYNTARVVARASVQADLQSTLNVIAEGTQNALGCDAVTLYVYDQVTSKLGHPPTMVGVNYTDRVKLTENVPEDSIVYKMLRRDEPYIVETVAQDADWRDLRFAKDEGIKSCVAIPLQAAGQKVGVMFVNYRARHSFTGGELDDIELFAHQAAVAIRNAQLYEEATRRTNALQAIYEAGTAVTSTLALDEILTRIVEQALLITGRYGDQARLSYLALKEGTKLRVKAIRPLDHPTGLGGEHEILVDLERDEPIGIIGRAVKTGQSQLVDDVTQDSDYLEYDRETHSQLAVPIKLGQEVIGVISMEHPKLGSFGEQDQQTLEAMAAQAAIAIQNARQYEELRRTKGLVGARTALAWMGMASSTWRHSTAKHALTIQEQAELLRRDMRRLSPPISDKRIADRIGMIQRLAVRIRDKPTTMPLSTEEGLELVLLNALVSERARQLWQNWPYKRVVLHLDLQLPDSATVSANSEWLRRAFDILVENAVEAVAGCKKQEVVIGSRMATGGAEVFIRDTGPGIPEEIRALVGMEVIEKPEDVLGLGMGLLMAQTIVQTYGGEIRVGSTSSTGTTMVIWLPLETKE